MIDLKGKRLLSRFIDSHAQAYIMAENLLSYLIFQYWHNNYFGEFFNHRIYGGFYYGKGKYRFGTTQL